MHDDRVRIFISSPADVNHERALVKDLIERLGQEYLPYFTLQAILWEEEALTADRTFQAGLTQPEDCDIVLVILWTRLGSPLPEEPYRGMTGTEWEFVNAVEASTANGRPEVLVYRKTTPKLVDITDAEVAREAITDRTRVETFFRDNFFNDDNSFRRAFRTFDGDAEFRELVEMQLRKLLNRRISAERRRATGDLQWRGSPFRPDRPFELGDERVFTGREQEVRDLLLRLERGAAGGSGFVLLSGPSGSGKTSLLRAGLLPRLTRPFQFEEVASVRACLVDPGRDGPTPLAALAARLCADEVLGTALGRFGLDADGLARLLATEPAVAARQVASATGTLAPTRGSEGRVRLAVLVDPFEAALAAGSDALSAFAGALRALAEGGNAWVVAALRSDALPELARLPALAGLIDAQRWSALEPPAPARIRQVIEIPARIAGIDIETREAGGDRGLVELLEADAGELRLWPPPVQAVLDTAYQDALAGGRRNEAGELRIGTDEVRRRGGIAGEVLARAQAVWDGLDDDARAALPMLCRALVALDAGGPGRAVARAGDLRVLRADAACRRLVDALIDARLVVAEAVRDPTLQVHCEPPDYRVASALRAVWRQGREEWSTRWGQRRARAAATTSADELAPAAAPAASPVASPVTASIAPTAPAAGSDDDADPGTDIDWGEYRPVAAFAHPALIRDFAPVRAWLAQPDNRLLLTLRLQLTRQAQLWKRTDCNREYLFREAGYAAAQRLVRVCGTELEPLEQEYLAQSRAHLGFLRRRNRLFRAIGAALVGLVAIATVAAWVAYRASERAEVNLHRSKLKEAELLIARGNTPQAVSLALDAAADLPHKAVQTLSVAFSSNRLLAMERSRGNNGEPRIPAFSADGERLATLVPERGARLWRREHGRFVPDRELAGAGLGLHSLVIGDDEQVFGIGTGGVWRLPAQRDAEPLYPCGSAPGGVFALDPARRSLALADVGTDGTPRVCVADLALPGRLRFQGPVPDGEVRGLSFAPDGDALLTASADGRTHLIDLEAGRVALSLPAEGPLGRPFNNAVFDADGGRIAIAAADERVRLYRRDGTPIAELSETEVGGRRFKVHNSAVRDVAFTGSGAFLIAADDDGQVVRWTLTDPPQAVLIGSHDLSVSDVAVADPPDDVVAETVALSASLDRTVRLWGVETGRPVAVLGHDGPVTAARFSADGARVMSYSHRDGSARLWSLDPVSRLAFRLRHPDHVWQLAMSAAPPDLALDGEALLLATAGFDGGVRVWRYRRNDPMAEPEPLGTWMDHAAAVRQVSFSADGRRLASAGYDGSALVRDLVNGATCRLAASGDDGQVYNALFGPDAAWVLTTSNDPEQPVRAFSVARCAALDVASALDHGDAPVEAATIAAQPGGALIATGDGDGTLRVIEAADTGPWQPRCEVAAGVGPIGSIAVSPDGALIGVAGSDSSAALVAVDGDGCRIAARLGGHNARVYSIAFSPDGRLVATASLDKTGRVWGRDGTPRAVLVGHQDRVYRAGFSPDGQFLLTASRDGKILFWRRPGGDAAGLLTLDPVMLLVANLGGVANAAFSPDGHYVAGAYWENAAVLFRLWSDHEKVPKDLIATWGPERARLALVQDAYRFRADNPVDDADADLDEPADAVAPPGGQ